MMCGKYKTEIKFNKNKYKVKYSYIDMEFYFPSSNREGGRKKRNAMN